MENIGEYGLLLAIMTKPNEKLDEAWDRFHSELDELLRLLAARYRTVKGRPTKFMHRETAVAEAVLAAQLRLRQATR